MQTCHLTAIEYASFDKQHCWRCSHTKRTARLCSGRRKCAAFMFCTICRGNPQVRHDWWLGFPARTGPSMSDFLKPHRASWQVDLVDVSPTNRQRQWETLHCRVANVAAPSADGADISGDSVSPAAGVSDITGAQVRRHSARKRSIPWVRHEPRHCRPSCSGPSKEPLLYSQVWASM